MLPSAPSTWGRRSINWFSSGMTRLTATPARARRLALPLSVSLNRATSRWAGSIYWLLFLTARLCASATACWKRVVSLSNLMSWVPHGQWEFVNAINVRTLTPISSHPRCNLPESRADPAPVDTESKLVKLLPAKNRPRERQNARSHTQMGKQCGHPSALLDAEEPARGHR